MRYRWMTWTLLAASLMTLGAARTLAAPQDSADEGIVTEQQARDLGLNDDQKTQIKSISQNRRGQIQAVQQDPSLTREQRREKIREINRSANQQIDGLLTPEQQQRFHRRARDRREDRRDRMHDGGRRDRRHPPRPPRSPRG